VTNGSTFNRAEFLWTWTGFFLKRHSTPLISLMTVNADAHKCWQFWARWIQSTSSHHFSWISLLISHLDLPGEFVPSGLQITTLDAAVILKIHVFWDVMPCRLIYSHWYFWGTTPLPVVGSFTSTHDTISPNTWISTSTALRTSGFQLSLSAYMLPVPPIQPAWIWLLLQVTSTCPAIERCPHWPH